MFDPVDPRLIDVPLNIDSGYPDDIAAGDTVDVLRDICGDASRDFPQSLWIEPSDWPDAIREAEKNKTMAIHNVDACVVESPLEDRSCSPSQSSSVAMADR